MNMRSLMALLALALAFACIIYNNASSEVDIDYSHLVVGTGTLITDYRMEDEKSSEASGKVRGTGNVMNKYLFLSGNDSQNVTIEDMFTLSGVISAANESIGLNFSSFPPGPIEPNKFRLTGSAWAERLTIQGVLNGSTLNGSALNGSALNGSILNG